MCRRRRFEFVGGLYHVMFRGNRRQAIFLDDHDRRFLLDKLRRLKSRFDTEIYAFVLMPNHVHLVLRRRHDPIERFMASLLTTFARYFNRRYGLVGHVFQGRYLCVACEDETYLLRVVRYVHRNPFRAGVVVNVNSPWSSYSAYLVDRPDGVVDREPVLRRFGSDVEAARKAFKEFHESEDAAADTRQDFLPRRGAVLGSAPFEGRVRRRAARSSDLPGTSRPRLEDVLRRAVESAPLRVEPIEVRGPSRRRAASLARIAFLEAAIDGHGYGYAELAGFLARSPESLRVMLARRRATRESAALRDP